MCFVRFLSFCLFCLIIEIIIIETTIKGTIKRDWNDCVDFYEFKSKLSYNRGQIYSKSSINVLQLNEIST